MECSHSSTQKNIYIFNEMLEYKKDQKKIIKNWTEGDRKIPVYVIANICAI